MTAPRKKMTDKDKKLLWGKAGGRCSICQKLVINTEDSDNIGVITGVESHIVGHSKKGPRGSYEVDLDQRHKYQNMILLCSEHAKTIDERTDFWTIEKLRSQKQLHEEVMSKLRFPNIKVMPKLKLIEPTGQSRGSSQGHFHKYSVRNFGKGEAFNLKFWIRGWGYNSKLLDIKNKSYLDEKEIIELELRVDRTPIHTQVIPFLKFYATYQNLDDETISYISDLIQIPTPGGEILNTKIAGEEKYELQTKEINIDSMEILPSLGDYTQAYYETGSNSFKIKVSRTLLACWGISEENILDCLYDLGLCNLKVMMELDAYQDKEYTTMSFPKTEKVGHERFVEALEFIRNGEYEII